MGRWSEPRRLYLVTFTTFERRPFFREFLLAATACRALSRGLSANEGALICWVLMPDHFHAMLQLADQTAVSRCVQKLKGKSSMACRQTMRAPVPVWACAFHDHALRKDEDSATLARYVIANPVRAGLVNDVLDYPWWDATWL